MWLKLKEGETAQATLDFTSIKSVAKHWTGSRSELCLGQGCSHCLQGIPRRWRYQAMLLIDRATTNWEFGEQVMVELNNILHDTNWAHITITRLGVGRDTRYQISQSEAKHKKRRNFLLMMAHILPPNMLNGNILAKHILYNLLYAAKCGRQPCSRGKKASKAIHSSKRPGGKVTSIRT